MKMCYIQTYCAVCAGSVPTCSLQSQIKPSSLPPTSRPASSLSRLQTPLRPFLPDFLFTSDPTHSLPPSGRSPANQTEPECS